MTELWYRYEDKRYAAPLNEWDEPEGQGRLVVNLRKFEVLKHTPKGVWLRALGCSDKHFVLLQSTKRFACPTIEEAKASFTARKNKQIRIHQAQINNAKEALFLLNNSPALAFGHCSST